MDERKKKLIQLIFLLGLALTIIGDAVVKILGPQVGIS